jgi:prepilin signal peptidase PulO-like enzyme (type II secretory pathway)
LERAETQAEYRMPRIFWGLVTALVASWLSMNLWTAPRLEELAGGLRLLEMRIAGYSLDDAQNFIAAIGDEGTALYLDRQLPLDTVFPPLLAAVLFLFYRWLFRGKAALTIGVAALTTVVVDYLENAAVAAMLRAGADGLTPELAASAHRWTTTKWSLSLIGLVALVLGLVLRLRHRWTATRK